MKIEIDFKIIGSRIQKCRSEKKMTQSELAEKIDTNQKHLSRIEGGYHRTSLDTIVAIAKALDVSVADLIADYDNSNTPSALQVVFDDIRSLSPTQLEMLKENIQTIKRYSK